MKKTFATAGIPRKSPFQEKREIVEKHSFFSNFIIPNFANFVKAKMKMYLRNIVNKL